MLSLATLLSTPCKYRDVPTRRPVGAGQKHFNCDALRNWDRYNSDSRPVSIVESLVAAGVFVHSQSTLYPEHNGNPDQSARTVPLPAAAAVTQLGFEPLSFLLQCDTGSVPKHISTSRETVSDLAVGAWISYVLYFKCTEAVESLESIVVFSDCYIYQARYFGMYVRVKKKRINNALCAHFEKKKAQ